MYVIDIFLGLVIVIAIIVALYYVICAVYWCIETIFVVIYRMMPILLIIAIPWFLYSYYYLN